MQTRVIGQTAVVAQRHVFFLPLFVQAFAAALVQVSLLQGDSAAAAQFAGGKASILVVLFGRVEQVGPSPGLPANVYDV